MYLQATGNSGTFMTTELLKTGKHVVTAITRADSQIEPPEGVVVKKVDYDRPASLVEALRGQDALVITLGGMAPPDIQPKLIQAACDAGVPWILPNEWSPDTAHEGLCQDVQFFGAKRAVRDRFAELPECSYIAVVTGFWYEWMLGMGAMTFGFDFANRAVTLFDDGETAISLSTWPQVGRAVAALLSLPIQPEDGAEERCLAYLKNKVVYIKSFTVSQKDMLDSALRVTHTTLEDWTVSKEPAQQRYRQGLEAAQKGDRTGFAKAMTTRVFFSDGAGNHEKTKGTSNDLLGLPEESIDEATERAIERARTPHG